MKKYLVSLLLLLIAVPVFLLLKPGTGAALSHKAVFSVGEKSYVVDGQTKTMDVAPFIFNSRAYVPVRFLGTALGVQEDNIVWDESSWSVVLSLEGADVRFTVDSPVILVKDEEKAMDAVPLLRDGRVFLPAHWMAESLGYEVKWDEDSGAVLLGPPGDLPDPPRREPLNLPAVGSYDNLKSLLANVETQYNGLLMRSASPQGAGEKAAQADVQQSAGSADYSKTNVQVEGVDEADIVKTDGNFIYQVSGERIIITKAVPAGEMKNTSILDYTGKDFFPQEIYVDDRYLTVIGHTRQHGYYPKIKTDQEAERVMGLIPPYYMQNTVKVVIYEISDKSNPKQVRELEFTGRYASSRKIGSSVYLVANKQIFCFPGKEIDDPKPAYRDTAVDDGFIEIDYPEIKYFPDCVEPNYLIVAGFNLDHPGEKANVYTYLGSGENIYSSSKNLYVAVANRQPYRILERSGLLIPSPVIDRQKTKIYKFALDGGRLTCSAQGEAPGTILNQFSMDEYNGFFRIATTTGDIWRAGEDTSKNNIYVLDSKLNQAGKLEDIAPGEKIYSVRFAGDRGYMVTFKTVDPFFVIDLKTPENPQILGALKIPGYSDYLHPYDENHIIGFGKDTVEIGQKDGEGNERGSMAFYQGMKMALFDVSDVKSPVEMFREKIGDRGTDSELLHNHKALLFSKEDNLLAFPVRVMEVKGSDITETGIPQYGEFVFQGACVYNIDLVNGFALKGKITHLSDEDYLKAGKYWYNSDKNVERIIYIGDTLYTLSKKFIKANNLEDLKEIKTIEIE